AGNEDGAAGDTGFAGRGRGRPSCGGPSPGLCQPGRPFTPSSLQRRALFRASPLSVEMSRELLSTHNPALYPRRVSPAVARTNAAMAAGTTSTTTTTAAAAAAVTSQSWGSAAAAAVAASAAAAAAATAGGG
ncbi:unnamed protein product, partial [Scytosiphon promiscuus]